MSNVKYYIKIKDKKIPLVIRNYRNSQNVKIYFKGDTLNISKPLFLSDNEVNKLIEENENVIYEEYIKAVSQNNNKYKCWNTGETFLYMGEKFEIIRKTQNITNLSINIDIDKKQFVITIPDTLKDEYTIKLNIDRGIKKILKNNTEVLIQERLPYLSKLTGIKYNSFKVRDAITRYGSCQPANSMLHFSSRLVMLPVDIVDAIIVHELCHMIHKNHSKEFYELVKRYIPDYDKKDKWLKENSTSLLF